MRKRKMHMIRAESFEDTSEDKQKFLFQRISENLEISMAKSNQARRKSEFLLR